MHVVLPWAWPPHGSYLSQGFLAVARVLHESGYPLLVLELMALKPPFSSLHCCSEPPGPETSSRYYPLHGLSCPWVSGGNTVDVLTWRCLSLATPFLGDAFARQRLSGTTPFLGDAPSGQPVDLPSFLWGPRAVPPCVDFDLDFWSTPRDGT